MIWNSANPITLYPRLRCSDVRGLVVAGGVPEHGEHADGVLRGELLHLLPRFRVPSLATERARPRRERIVELERADLHPPRDPVVEQLPVGVVALRLLRDAPVPHVDETEVPTVEVVLQM